MESTIRSQDRKCTSRPLQETIEQDTDQRCPRWISSAQVAKKMVLLARTTPLEEVKKPSEGLSLFFMDFDKTAPGLELKKIKKMGGRAVDANEVFFDNYRVLADALIGEEGQGFKIVRAT